MTNIKTVPVNKDGWSRWQTPIMKGYKMQCCDCGLIHEMEFEVIKEGKKLAKGWFKAQLIKNGRVRMRAKRWEEALGRKG